MVAHKSYLNINMKNWTDKHHKFCVKNSLYGCVRNLYEFLVMTEGENQHIEVDLKHEFNHWIEKNRRQPYHRDTIKRAWNKLVELKLILVAKRYSWCVWSCTLVSLDQLKPRKKSRKRTQARGFAPSNPHSPKKELLQQQHLFSDLLKSINVTIQPKYLKRLLKFTIEELKDAITLFKARIQTREIKNPPGFIVDCLENSWCYEPFNSKYIGQKYIY